MLDKWMFFNQTLNIKISDYQKNQLMNYYQILKTENEKYNLTRIIDFEDVFYKHFVDSLLFTKDLKIDDQIILDIGSGAGFPGIVLKILFPRTKITLLDSNNKKVNFLNTVINKLKLDGINATYSRAEELSRVENEQYDIVVSRAVAYMDIVLELSVRFAKVNGLIVLLKGPRAKEELDKTVNLCKKLEISLVNIYKHSYDEIGERNNLVFVKNKMTPNAFPRDFAKIVKESAKNNV